MKLYDERRSQSGRGREKNREIERDEKEESGERDEAGEMERERKTKVVIYIKSQLSIILLIKRREAEKFTLKSR